MPWASMLFDTRLALAKETPSLCPIMACQPRRNRAVIASHPLATIGDAFQLRAHSEYQFHLCLRRRRHHRRCCHCDENPESPHGLIGVGVARAVSVIRTHLMGIAVPCRWAQALLGNCRTFRRERHSLHRLALGGHRRPACSRQRSSRRRRNRCDAGTVNVLVEQCRAWNVSLNNSRQEGCA